MESGEIQAASVQISKWIRKNEQRKGCQKEGPSSDWTNLALVLPARTARTARRSFFRN